MDWCRSSPASIASSSGFCRWYSPDDWDKLCYHRLQPETVRSKVDIRIAELAMHEWDIHCAFDPDAALAEDSLAGLINASGRAVRRAFRPDPARTSPWCATASTLSGPGATSAVDVVRWRRKEPSFEIGAQSLESRTWSSVCTSATYAMIIFGRWKLPDVIARTASSPPSGDRQRLIDAFVSAFVGG